MMRRQTVSPSDGDGVAPAGFEDRARIPGIVSPQGRGRQIAVQLPPEGDHVDVVEWNAVEQTRWRDHGRDAQAIHEFREGRTGAGFRFWRPCPCRRRRLGGAGGPISCLALWENAAPRTSAPPTAAPVHLRKSRLPGSASACFFPAFMMRTPGRICRPQGFVHRRFRGRRSARLPTWLDGEYNNVNRASAVATKVAARSLLSAPVPRRTLRAQRTRPPHGPRVHPG